MLPIYLKAVAPGRDIPLAAEGPQLDGTAEGPLAKVVPLAALRPMMVPPESHGFSARFGALAFFEIEDCVGSVQEHTSFSLYDQNCMYALTRFCDGTLEL